MIDLTVSQTNNLNANLYIPFLVQPVRRPPPIVMLHRGPTRSQSEIAVSQASSGETDERLLSAADPLVA